MVKLEQSQMAEDMQYMLQNFNMVSFYWCPLELPLTVLPCSPWRLPV